MISECIRTNRCGDNRTRDQQWYPWSDIVLAKNEQTYGNLTALVPEQLNSKEQPMARHNIEFDVILKSYKEVS